jgi:hypothetical protein
MAVSNTNLFVGCKGSVHVLDPQGNPVRKKKRSKNAVHGGTLLYVVVVTYVTVMTILCIE